jgi:Cysteine rich repeat
VYEVFDGGVTGGTLAKSISFGAILPGAFQFSGRSNFCPALGLRHREASKGEEPMKVIYASLFALALLPSAAHAVTSYSLSGVCKMDIEQYCKGIRKNRLREMKECLAKHDKDLFPQCQDHYREATKG